MSQETKKEDDGQEQSADPSDFNPNAGEFIFKGLYHK